MINAKDGASACEHTIDAHCSARFLYLGKITDLPKLFACRDDKSVILSINPQMKMLIGCLCVCVCGWGMCVNLTRTEDERMHKRSFYNTCGKKTECHSIPPSSLLLCISEYLSYHIKWRNVTHTHTQIHTIKKIR